MRELLVATAEFDLDLVNEMREESKPQSRLHSIPSEPLTAVAVAAPSAPALDNEVIGPDGFEAMSWALKTNDQALIRSVCNALPSWCIKEQIHLFNRRDVSMVLKLKEDKIDWLMLVCRFPPQGAKIPDMVMRSMMAIMESGAVLVCGLFGNVGPQLRDLFQDRGAGAPIHQGWKGVHPDAPEEFHTYPAYWVILANHKQKKSKSEQALPLYQQMLDLPQSAFDKPRKE